MNTTSMKTNAIIFDMDGVLINSEPLWMQAEIEIFKTVGLQLTLQDCEATRGVRINNVVEHWYQQQPWINKSIEQITLEISNRLIEMIYESGEALEGLYESLNLISKLEIPMGIATSSSENIIEAVIAKLDIRKYFKAIHSADHEKFGKPHPAVYLNCAEKLNVDPMHCIAIEDSITGVIAAKAARMKVIAIPETNAFHDNRFAIADLKLNSLLQLNAAVIDNLTNQNRY